MNAVENPVYEQHRAAEYAEQCVVGAVLNSAGVGVDTLELSGSMFYSSDLGRFFELLRDMRDAGKPIDPQAVVLVLKSAKTSNGCLLDAIGGVARVAKLMTEYGIVSQIGYYADQVKRWHQVRHMRTKLTTAMREIDSVNADPAEIAKQLDASLQLQLHIERNESQSFGQMTADALEDCFNEATYDLIVPYGSRELDARCGGLYGGEVTTIGARPSVGKTAMAITVAMNAAKAGKRVTYVSCEMSHRELGHRFLSMETSIPVAKIRNGYLAEFEKAKLRKAVETIRPLMGRAWVASHPTVQAIRARCRLDIASDGLDLLIIDYIGLLKSTSKGSIYEKVTELSREIKGLAVELNIPILLMCQLNREAGKTSEPPRLEHLRDSGAIEQDSSNVIFIHRKRDESQTTIVIAKQRQGAVQTFDMHFNGNRCCFEDIDQQVSEEIADEDDSTRHYAQSDFPLN